MSIGRFLSVLGCCCTSAAVAFAGGSAAELELAEAEGPSLYLRLDAGARVLQVMARGVQLDSIQAEAVRLLVQRAGGQPAMAAEFAVPTVLRVASPPAVAWRRVIAPATLVPYQEGASLPTPAPTPLAELPDQFTVELDNGWVVHVGPDRPDRWRRRFAERIASGWQRLLGRQSPPAPPALVIVTRSDDSRRLLHLLAAGTPILVLCGSES